MAEHLQYSRRTIVAEPRSRVLEAILSAGMTCGVLDITAALLWYGALGVAPVRLLQGIASGLLGSRAFEGGLPVAVLGLLCHFSIAFSASAVYVMASQWLRFLVRHAIASGVTYAFVVYFFMQLVVIPLSAAKTRGFSWRMTLIGLVIHIFCVGLPIALTARRYPQRA